MTIIKKLCEMISEEIEDADKYAECALHHKEDDRSLAETFWKLSTEELQHAEMLHDHVVRMIKEYKSEHGEPPAAMQAVYDYVHEKEIDHVVEVKTKLTLYKG